MITGFGNNVVSSLASDITSTQTSFAVMPGTGEQFSQLLTTDIINVDSPHEIYAKLTITDSQQTVFEICHLMAVSQDTLTVIRAQEGTAAKGWSLNDVVANFATRGSEQGFVQVEQLQAGDFTAATAGGSANALAISLPSTFFINGRSEFILRVPLLIKPILNNSGPVTIQLTVSGRVIGTYPIVKGINTNLIAGDIAKDNPIYIIFSPELSRFIIINPVNGLVDGALFLQKSQNLSDVANKATARTSLELKGAALLDVGTAANTVAAGDDQRIVDAISSKNTNIVLPGALTVTSDSRAGRLLSKSDLIAGEGRVGGHATLAVDGNVHGTVWGGALSTYIGNLRNTASGGAMVGIVMLQQGSLCNGLKEHLVRVLTKR
ncbi:TPA: hypothetical protein ACQ39K_001953 [Yersinia enterocolitica]